MIGLEKQEPFFSRGRPSGGRRLYRGAALLLILFAAVPAVPHILSLRLPVPTAGPADAVIVLSGGAGRIAEGYRAWSSGAGRDFCILGAGRGVKPDRLLPQEVSLPQEALSRIHVEGWSENTLENAFSAKALAERRGYSSMILVTSDYHVPRAYLAFRRVLPPEISLSVIPVRAENGTPGVSAWRWARRRFLEGWKYWSYRVLLRWE
jgi:uncharacterized SAM-binding protein YcdF (DUF218 family)